MSYKKLSVPEEFNKYLSSYIKRLSVFEELKKIFDIKKVLYPGSYCDVIPSLVFSNVVYVDSYKKTKKFFQDKNISNFIREHKQYKEKSYIVFHLDDYNKDFGERIDYFDLLISLSAGYISTSCKKYLKKNKILVTNNDHYDAARAFLEKDYRLIGVLDIINDSCVYTDSNLDDFFKLKSGEVLTIEKFELLASKSPSKSLKKLVKNSDLYVFLKERR
jgi:hypothetical protein